MVVPSGAGDRQSNGPFLPWRYLLAMLGMVVGTYGLKALVVAAVLWGGDDSIRIPLLLVLLCDIGWLALGRKALRHSARVSRRGAPQAGGEGTLDVERHVVGRLADDMRGLSRGDIASRAQFVVPRILGVLYALALGATCTSWVGVGATVAVVVGALALDAAAAAGTLWVMRHADGLRVVMDNVVKANEEPLASRGDRDPERDQPAR